MNYKTLLSASECADNIERFNSLPHNPFITALRMKPFENIVGEGKMLVTAFYPFSTMFTALIKTEIITYVTFNISSANASNLDKSKLLSFGKELPLYWKKLF